MAFDSPTMDKIVLKRKWGNGKGSRNCGQLAKVSVPNAKYARFGAVLENLVLDEDHGVD